MFLFVIKRLNFLGPPDKVFALAHILNHYYVSWTQLKLYTIALYFMKSLQQQAKDDYK